MIDHKELKELEEFVKKVNRYALTKIDFKESPKRWLLEKYQSYGNHELWKHLKHDANAKKYFTPQAVDPTEGIFMIDVNWLSSVKGNKLFTMGKEDFLEKNFGKIKLDCPWFSLSDETLGEGNHRVHFAKEHGLKAVPVRVFWGY